MNVIRHDNDCEHIGCALMFTETNIDDFCTKRLGNRPTVASAKRDKVRLGVALDVREIAFVKVGRRHRVYVRMEQGRLNPQEEK